MNGIFRALHLIIQQIACSFKMIFKMLLRVESIAKKIDFDYNVDN